MTPRSREWADLIANVVPLEQAVLGACLVYPSAIELAHEMATADDFVEPMHQALFAKIMEARKAGRGVTVSLLRAAFGEDAAADVGGITVSEYVGRLVHEAPVAVSVRDHIAALRDGASTRRIFSVAELIREKAARGINAGAPREIAVEAICELDRIVAAHQPDHLRRVSCGEAGVSAIEKMERARAGEKEGWGAPYGVPDLDRMTRGMHAGHLTIVAARPSMGKSAFGLAASLSAAKAGHAVLFISLEMSAEELAERALANLTFDNRSPIAYTSIRSGDIGDDQAARLHEAAVYMNRLPFVIEQQRGLSPSQIVARSRAAAQHLDRQGKRLALVVVDHLGKVRPSDRYAGNRTTELGEITGAFKDMAGELDCSVMALCQLNRQTEQRDNKRPTLGDLRESGRIEEDADNVLMLYRDGYYIERTKQQGEDTYDRQARLAAVANDMEIIVAKQRQGETGIVEAWCSMPCNVITGRG